MTTTWTTSRIGSRLVLIVVWGLSVIYVATLIDRGWGPPDEGLLAQSAERLLSGEVPHRDFDELYTGGLTAVHALAFELFGVRLISLRLVLFAAVILWVPVLYALARRFASPILAAAVTLLGVVWSVPAYPASMPSWYNLFLASAGLLAIFRYLETDRFRWQFVAGLCGGVSVLAKITGIFFIGAGVLVIVYQACRPVTPAQVYRGDITAMTRRESRPGAWLGMLAAVMILGGLVALIGIRKHALTYLQLAAPLVAVAVLVAAAGWNSGPVAWNRLWRPILALAAGVAAALLPFVAVYAWHDALADLVKGVFTLPARRIQFASQEPDGGAIVWALPLLGLAALGLHIRRRRTAALVAGLIMTLGLWILDAGVRHDFYGGIGGGGPVYRPVVDSVATILPIIASMFAIVMLGGTGHVRTGPGRSQAFAAVTVAAFSALIAFPYSNDLYFHYVAPLLCIAILALYAMSGRTVDAWITSATIAVYLLFGVTRVAVNSNARLAVDRGGLRVPQRDSAEVDAFVRTLREHARNGYTFATPDSPEAYFLTGLRNPTPTMYEFLGDSEGDTDRILAILEARRVTAVAISYWKIFSPRPDPRLLEALRVRYPHSTTVWHFWVRWNDAG